MMDLGEKIDKLGRVVRKRTIGKDDQCWTYDSIKRAIDHGF